MTPVLQAIVKKSHSLSGYMKVFRNWWIAAFARYAGGLMGPERLLQLRDGRRFFMRPASDFIALGEVFSAETYKACRGESEIRTVWDIGGNIGLFVIWAAPFFPQAQFDSFEPCAPTFDLLRRNQEINPNIPWRVHPFGLSARNEVCEGHVPRGLYGSASRYRTGGDTIDLPMRSVEDAWREMGSPSVDLLKIDCEGGEYDIIEAMPNALLHSVRIILMELHKVEGKDPTRLIKRLKTFGFYLDQPPSFSTILVARKR